MNLEKQIYHLYASKQDFKLKEKMSNIENFLLMYNSLFKYEFCRYWQKLEEKGFDPVMGNFFIQNTINQLTCLKLDTNPNQMIFFTSFCSYLAFLKSSANLKHKPHQTSDILLSKEELSQNKQVLFKFRSFARIKIT